MYEEIKEQFQSIIEFSQDMSVGSQHIDSLFDQWLEAKRDIIEAFDGKLIWELPEPVQFHLDPNDRTKHFDEFVFRISAVYDNKDLAEFLAQNQDGFYDNIVNSPYEKDNVKVPKGMKLVKAFKYFEKDQKLLEQLQIQASQVIQEDKIEGKLCLSVHPLDYLSVSTNTYNWRSCHALDGEYRAGNLSYMLDKSTIVCYLKGADNEILPSFPYDIKWNSKKWRVLIYLSEKWDMIFAGRQYPFASMSGLNMTYNALMTALKLNPMHFSGWKNDYLSYFMTKNGDKYHFNTIYIPIHGKLHEYCDIVEDGKYSLQFNDLLRSSTYHEPYYALKDQCYWWSIPDEIPKFTIGAEVGCLCCGGQRVRDPDMMVCRDCADAYGLYDEDHMVCDCCGTRVYEDDYYCVQGENLCRNCYENETFVCECCDEVYFNDEKHYDRERDRYLCTECYENLED